VEQAFKKFETSRNIASYKSLREAFDGRRHPDVAAGRKSPDEAVSEFLDIFELHHATFNSLRKTD
jgi:hypothetical protein